MSIDTDFDLMSDGLIQHCIEKGWWTPCRSPESGASPENKFNWKKVMADWEDDSDDQETIL